MPKATQVTAVAHLRMRLEELSPAYFGMVMATGIVSIAAHLLEMPFVAVTLLWLNAATYLVLWVLNVLRLVLFPSSFWRDVVDHRRGPGFFTFVAGSCVLGSQMLLISENLQIAITLWVIGLVLWIASTYTIFTAFTIKEEKPALDEGITGAWLLAVVATQSIAALSSLIASHWEQPFRLELNFLALSMWLWGGMLYIWMISLIFYRYTFFKLPPGDLTPPYWINMGAMAISTLAGSLLILNSSDAPFIRSLHPFITGFTVFYWATGTWWIPMLLILGFWRHVYKRFPWKYDPLYWGAVFPQGMYTACTFEMARAMHLEFLYVVPRYFFYVALLAWALVFLGLAYSLTEPLFTSAGQRRNAGK
jgi:tellurite resistance protein TehA-like permease